MPFEAITNEKLMCRTYSAAEVALILGVGKSTIFDNVHAGKLDHLRPVWIGNRLRFPREVIDRVVGGEAA